MSEVNTKKLASRTLENMILKAQVTLLNKSPSAVQEFNKILDRSKREISLSRGKNSPLKRVYAVETEASYNLLTKVLRTHAVTTEELANAIQNDTDLSNDQIRMFMLFRGVNLDQVFTAEEQTIFADLDIEDMKRNIYLGVDHSKTEG